jgi:EmrB/QacA subfamily drug resistance transporter
MALSNRDKTLTLIGVLLALFLGALDQTIVSTALPKIVEDLQGLDRFAWVATSYLLASTVLVPIYGKLADMVSRKSIELVAIGLFLVGSLLCGVAGEFGTLPILGDGMSQLIIFRAIQGLGGAGLFSLAFIIIADLYPPSVRGRYQGFVGATFGIASVVGPWIGGLLTDFGGGIIPGIEGWRWVFYVNVPFGALALWFIVRRMPPLEPQGERAPIDLVSASFLILGLVPLVLALQFERASYPWLGATTLGLLATSVVFIAAFIIRSVRSDNPILDMGLFRNRVFSTSMVALFFLGAAFLAAIIFLPLFMVNVVGVSATRAGVSLIPLSLGLVFGAIVSGQLVSAIGRYRLIMLVGIAIMLVGTVLLSTMSVDVAYWRVTLYMVILGLGIGPTLPLYTLAIQNAVDVRRVGQATSASQFFRQIGGTVGAAVLGGLLTASLAASFSNIDSGGAFDGGTFSGELRASGGANIEQSVREAFDEQFDLLAAAVRSDDPEALGAALESSPVPPLARTFMIAGATAARASGNVDTFLGTVRGQFDQQAEELITTVGGTIRQGFRDAITRLFQALIVVVLVGGIATSLVPVLPLRTTSDAAAAAAS